MSTWKFGPDLKVGEVVKFWVNGEQGMRIEKIMPYTGRYPDICCSVALLRAETGAKAGRVVETAVEHRARYEVIEEKS